jgi:hypothetical protein
MFFLSRVRERMPEGQVRAIRGERSYELALTPALSRKREREQVAQAGEIMGVGFCPPSRCRRMMRWAKAHPMK